MDAARTERRIRADRAMEGFELRALWVEEADQRRDLPFLGEAPLAGFHADAGGIQTGREWVERVGIHDLPPLDVALDLVGDDQALAASIHAEARDARAAIDALHLDDAGGEAGPVRAAVRPDRHASRGR